MSAPTVYAIQHGGRTYRYATLAAALVVAGRIFTATGVVVGVVAVPR